MQLVFGHSDTVARWYEDKTGKAPPVYDTAIGVIDADGVLQAAFVLRKDSAATINMGLYSERVNLSAIARQLFGVIFNNFHRLQIRVAKSNKQMKKHAPRLGFKFEGVLKDYYGPGKDAVAFYMTRETCRWINGRTRRTSTDRHQGVSSRAA